MKNTKCVVRNDGSTLAMDIHRLFLADALKVSLSLSLVLLSGLSISAKAAEYGMTMQGGGYYTTNSNQSSTPVPDRYLQFIWGGSYLNSSPRMSTDIRGSVQTTISRNSGDANLYPRGDAGINLVLIKERLDWMLRDRIGIVRTDSLQSDIPVNQEIANVFITGPTIMVRFGAVNRAIIEARYEVADFQRSVANNSIKHGGAFRWEHLMSPVKTLSLNLETKKVMAAENYTRYDGFLTYRKTSTKNTLELNAGSTVIDRYTDPKLNLDNYSLQYEHRSNSRTSWVFNTNRGYSDLGDAIVTPVDNEDPLTRDAGIFVQTGNSLSFNYAYADKNSAIRFFQRDREYVFTPISEKATGLRINYEQKVKRNSSIGLTMEYTNTFYSDFSNSDIERSTSAEYGFSINRELTWKTGLLYRDRLSTLASRNFNETIIYTNFLLNRVNRHR